MTCIVGLVEKGNVYIGGDSAGVKDSNLRVREDKKVFSRESMIFGFTSSFRMGQIIQYCLVIPDQGQQKSDFDYLCTDFVDALIECFKDKGYATIKDGEVIGGFFLMGYKGNLYQVENDFQISKCVDKFDACGCGESYALGAMKTMETVKDIEPEKKLTNALMVAEWYSAGVRGPFTIVKL